MNGKLFEVLIEMPKGETRRLHLSWSREDWIDLGPIKKVIPINKGIMPIAYGFVIGTLIKEGDKEDELDALVYSKRKFKIGSRIKISPIASLHIKNGDNKVIGTDGSIKAGEWNDIPKNLRNTLIRYFGYKSPVTKIGDKRDAIELINKARTNKPLKIPKKITVMKAD